MNVLCLYHGRDFDGASSGFIVKTFYEKRGHEVTLEPIDYGYPTPWHLIEGKDEVVIVDFSLSPEDILKVASMCKSLIWIDHHISQIKEWNLFVKEHNPSLHNITTVLVDGQSGCELAWDYFYSGEARPYIVQLLGRYDVWDLTQETWHSQILPFQWGLKSENMDPRLETACRDWKLLFGFGVFGDDKEAIQTVMEKGRIILTYQLSSNEWYCRYGREVEFLDRSGYYKGFRTYALNTGLKSSLMFQHLIDQDAYDVYLAYVHTKDGFDVSIYNTNGKIDCSVIAKSWGGGGHRGAAGFKREIADFFGEIIEGSYEYTFGGTGLPDTRLTSRVAENSNVPS